MPIIIRQAKEEDTPVLEDLYLQFSQWPLERGLTLRKIVKEKTSELLVAESNQEIVGRNKPSELEKRDTVYELASKMITGFEKEFGNSLCKNLTKCDLRTPEGHEKFESQKIRETLCPKFVKWSANYTKRLIETR